VSPLEAAVVSITKFTAGETHNIIPSEVRERLESDELWLTPRKVRLAGTIRSLTQRGLDDLRDALVALAKSTAEVSH
jgi:metal-dependent amidase/aminoacylase/carboxypeptidase family protein